MDKIFDFLHPDRLKEWSIDVFKAIGEGILIADVEGVIQYVNPAYLRIMKMEENDVLGKSVAVVRPGAMLPTVIKTGKSILGFYRKVKDVEYIVDMFPIIINTKIVGGVSIARDITEVTKLTEQLQKAHCKIMNLEDTVYGLFSARFVFQDLLGNNQKFKRVIELAEKAALCESNVLIIGESGTGKELIAQAIHNASRRRQRHFVAINVSAIPSELLESELFGYASGAFTGSKKGGKPGLFQLADGGTLFLDEIGEMAFDLQSKLLRFLQEQKIRRVGEVEETMVDVRVIAATNRNIETMMENGRFRQDLFYRLNVFQLKISPLRERKEDIILLANHFAEQYCSHRSSTLEFSQEVQDIFFSYDWPGNIRELKNTVEYACNIVLTGNRILPKHIPDRILEHVDCKKKTPDCIETLQQYTKDHEKAVILELMQTYGHSLEGKKKVCEMLGLSLSTLYRKLA